VNTHPAQACGLSMLTIAKVPDIPHEEPFKVQGKQVICT
jgi:hypothetical protein